jgi:glycosyltransferase involved in cell wall biosynthesis
MEPMRTNAESPEAAAALDVPSNRNGARNGARVLIVTPQPFYEDRGTPIAVRYVANALSEIGVEVDLLAFPVGQDVSIRNVTVHRCANPLGIKRVPIGLSWRKIVLDASLWRSFSRLIATHRYDMVHAVEEAAYMAAAICPRAAQPFIYDMASAIPLQLQRKPGLKSRLAQRMLRSVERRILNRASHIICSTGLANYVHEQAADASVSEWRFPAHSAPVPGSDVESLRQQLQIQPDQRVLLYSGNFADYQGIELLLAAFARARQLRPELVLVCVGATERELANWSRQPSKDGSEQVRIVPRQPRERIPVYTELADLLVLPRVGPDNIPLKLYDYMASGKPIVATRHAGYGALLNGARALLCEPTADSLATALVRACTFPGEAAAAAYRSLNYARRHFGWSPFVEFVRDTYGNALARAQGHEGLPPEALQ